VEGCGRACLEICFRGNWKINRMEFSGEAREATIWVKLTEHLFSYCSSFLLLLSFPFEYRNRLGSMGVKWKDLSKETKSSFETMLLNNYGWMNVSDLSLVLRGFMFLDYKWQENEAVSESIFSVFHTLFTSEESFSLQTHVEFVKCIYAFSEMGLEWAALSADVKRAIFEGIEKRSSFVFRARELSRLFVG
jgi:hypothetical protein